MQRLFYLCYSLLLCIYSIPSMVYAYMARPEPVSISRHLSNAKCSDIYRVRKGDTLYSVARFVGRDYRYLAHINHLLTPYSIYPSQSLCVVAKGTVQRVDGVKQPKRAKQALAHRAHHPILHWSWPIKGWILRGFSTGITGNTGLDIVGHLGGLVYAAAAGEVVYSGDGLRGYGNLLLIQHADHYLSAYAHNKRFLVRLGQRVKAGQPIAIMGADRKGRVLLHFEIRHQGKPVDPSVYLPGLDISSSNSKRRYMPT